MKNDNNKLSIVLVDWLDSCGDPGWKFSEEISVHLMVCQTVGFLVSETKEAIAVALNRTTTLGYKPFGDIISIPRVAIRKIKILAKVDHPK